MKYLKSVEIVKDDISFIGFGASGGTYEILCPKCKKLVRADYYYSKELNLIPKYCCYCGKKWVREKEQSE